MGKFLVTVTMENTLDTFLDAIPHNKLFAFGGDTGNPLAGSWLG